MHNYSSGVCGGDFTEPFGHLSSPSFPQQYPPKEDCEYTISQANGKFLKLMVQEFEINEVNCNEFHGSYTDYLEIRDGISEESPLIGKFCGDDIPAVIQSTQSKIWIR